MFAKNFNLLTVFTTSVLALPSFSLAQYGDGSYWDSVMNSLNLDFSTYDQTIQQSMEQLNQIVGQGQQQVDATVRQSMQDPAIQARYQSYQQQVLQQGSQPVDFYTYTYYFLATGGFSQQGVAAWQANEAANNAKVQEAYQGYQQAVEDYRNSVAEGSQHYYENQSEMGNVLQGNSTWVNPNDGSNHTLPYTWQRDSYNTYNNQTYYVDPSGTYYWLDPNNTGWMYPLSPWQAGQ
jgi:hypothetical protein